MPMSQWLYIIIMIVGMIAPEICAFLWWGSQITTRLKQVEQDRDRLYKEVEGINTVQTEIAVIKNTLSTQTDMLNEIRQTLKSHNKGI